jgi:hypoxanthine phosphoribosyltransferase
VRVLLSEPQIREGVIALARKIESHYRHKPLTVLGVLTGSLIFLSDLIRRMDVPLQVGVLQASSYRGATTTAGELAIDLQRVPDLTDRDVLLLDDIFDTGHTLQTLVTAISTRGPGSVKSAVLLWKIGTQRVDYTPDFHAFQIPNEFVVGYGLDYDDNYRHLPYIAALDPGDFKPPRM